MAGTPRTISLGINYWSHHSRLRGPTGPLRRDCIMAQHNGNRETALSRRHALAWITATGTTALYALSDAAGKRFSLFDQAEAAAIGHDKPVILVIVKDTTSFYW